MKKVFLAGGLLALLLMAAFAASLYVWQGVTRVPQFQVKTVAYNVTDRITVLGVDVPTNVKLIVELEAYNPNILSLRVVGGSYGVFLNDVRVGEGSVPAVEIPSGGRKTMDTEVTLSTASGIAGIMGAIQKGEMKARIDGEAYVELPVIGVKKLKFEKEANVFGRG